MRPSEILALINCMAAQTSRHEKQDLLKQMMGDPLGEFVIKQTYDPFITYGVTLKKMPKINDDPGIRITIQHDDIKELLNDLASRKLSGNAAKQAIDDLFFNLDADSADILFRILNKDLKAGIAASTIEAVYPGTLPIFSVMRAHKYEAKRVTKFPVYVEPKLDGMRVSFIASPDGRGAFFTRSGKAIPALQYLAEPLLTTAKQIVNTVPDEELVNYIKDGFMLDGEALNGLFEATGAIRRKDEEARDAELHTFDIVPYAEFMTANADGLPLSDRRRILEKFIGFVSCNSSSFFTTPLKEVSSHDHIDKLYGFFTSLTLAKYLSRGIASKEKQLLPLLIDEATGQPKCLEGAMVKDPASLYEKRKSHSWLKIKPEETEDLPVVGAFPGEPNTKYEHCLGGLIVDRNGVHVRVGGGFSDAQRGELWDLWKDDAGWIDSVNADPSVETVCKWLEDRAEPGALVGRLIEVKFHEVTPDGSLRHPRFIRFRDDKAGEVEVQEAA